MVKGEGKEFKDGDDLKEKICIESFNGCDYLNALFGLTRVQQLSMP